MISVMTVYIGSDHRGWQQKETAKNWLREKGENVIDLGAEKYEPEDDYTKIAIELAEKVAREKASGILWCGSGVGVCVAANKIKGVRAALCTSVKQAQLARSDDDANVLCLSADLVTVEENQKIIEMFLETVFSSEEKHIRRIKLISNYEEKIYES